MNNESVAQTPAINHLWETKKLVERGERTLQGTGLCRRVDRDTLIMYELMWKHKNKQKEKTIFNSTNLAFFFKLPFHLKTIQASL